MISLMLTLIVYFTQRLTYMAIRLTRILNKNATRKRYIFLACAHLYCRSISNPQNFDNHL